jgi:hypothetical protein
MTRSAVREEVGEVTHFGWESRRAAQLAIAAELQRAAASADV